MRIITLSYRKIIDISADKQWDKFVFEDSYMEFKMQAQNFSAGTAFTSYGEILRNVPDGQRLTGLITPAVSGYVQQLNGVVPDVLNNSGRRFLKFNRFQLEIINSDIHLKERHQIAINFFTVPQIWHDTIGDLMLVSEFAGTYQSEDEIYTYLLRMQPYLNIHSVKDVS